MIEINATILAQILNFVILVIFLRAVAYKPVCRLLEQRSNKIQSDLDKAEADKREAQQTLAQYRQKLQEANVRAQEIIDNAEKSARDAHDAKILETKRDVEQIKKTAAEDIERERAQAMEQMKSEVVALSLLAAGKVLGKNLDTKENDRLINEFISQLDKEKLGDLSC